MINYDLLTISSNTKNASKVLIIYTGGTLGMVYDNKLDSLVPFRFDQILENIPELKRLGTEIGVVALEKPIDSSNISPKIWVEIAKIIEKYQMLYDGFVILHGTDTMAYTASALSYMIQDLPKPIVLTGAQLPIGLPRTDARENLISSIEIAGSKIKNHAIVPEVCIYFNGRLLRGNRSKKQESSQLDAFESENYPYLANVGVEIEYNLANIKTINPIKKATFSYELDDKVGILKLFPGITLNAIEHFFSQDGLKGVVLETYGAGNAPSNYEFIEIVKKAISENIYILNVSQCVGGKVIMGKYETSRELLEMGVISGSDITTEAGITKLMFVLGQKLSKIENKKLLENCIAGEQS